MAKLKIVETDSVPICPYCNKELNAVEKKSKGWIEQFVAFLCPHCKKILSIGYNIGY